MMRSVTENNKPTVKPDKRKEWVNTPIADSYTVPRKRFHKY